MSLDSKVREQVDFEPDDPPIGRFASFTVLSITSAAVYVGAFVDVMLGVTLFAGSICIVGVDVARSWNDTLKEEREASLEQMRGVAVGIPILWAVLFPPMHEIHGTLLLAVVSSTANALVYAFILYAAALWDVDRDEFRIKSDPRTGLKRAFIDEETFIRKVERVALENASDEE